MHTFHSALWATPVILTGCALAQNTAPTATIESGPLRGRSTQAPTSGKTVHQFFGIPLAQPPVGDLRFAPPRAPEPWTEPLAVDEHPKVCPQLFGTPGPGTELAQTLFNDPPYEAEEDEDCLFLNVYVPEGGETEKAVLFWIHGGSGITGGVSLPMYDSTDLVAEQDIIVVMSQYRLGFYGNPGAPIQALPVNESSLALLDQRLALSWIQENVAAFGGDPEKVTVMGESAGGIAVGHFVNTYADNPPFRAAIEMSGSTVALAGMSVPDVDKGDANWQKIMDGLGCSSPENPSAEIACVKEADSDDIMRFLNDNNIRLMGTQPDNITQLEHPDIAWAEGSVAKVPLLIGSTAHDASYWVVAPILNLQETAGSSGNEPSAAVIPTVSELLRSQLNTSAETAVFIEELYTPGSAYYKGPNDTVSIVTAIGTDYTFRCTSGFVADLTRTILQQPVWQYDFTAIAPSTTFEDLPQLGAYHASELAFIFGTYNLTGKATEVDVELSKSIQGRFASFVKDPAGAGPGWAQFPKIGVLGLENGEPTTMEVGGREWAPVCALFDGLYLQELPALAALATGGEDSTTGGTEEEDAESSQAANSLRYNAAAVMGSVAFGIAAVL